MCKMNKMSEVHIKWTKFVSYDNFDTDRNILTSKNSWFFFFISQVFEQSLYHYGKFLNCKNLEFQNFLCLFHNWLDLLIPFTSELSGITAIEFFIREAFH